MASDTTSKQPEAQKGILGWIEKTGNALPDPVFIFFYLILALVVISVVLSLLGVSVQLNDQILAGLGEAGRARFGIGDDGVISVASLLSPANIQQLLTQMPSTFTHFHPLGYVLVVMLGAGVAERAGLFGTAMRAGVRNAPKFLLTPVVALIAMLGNHAADAGYVVLIPLAGVLYAAAGRHPVAGIAAAFAGVSGGFSANIAPGQLDALLFGITQAGVDLLNPNYLVNIAGNTYFIIGLLALYLPIIWYVTDRIIEPRLGKWTGGVAPGGEADQDDDPNAPLTDGQRKGLKWAGIATLGVIGVWVFLTIGPGTPLYNESADSVTAALAPLFTSLVAGFFILFLAAGTAYGVCAGTIKNHRDLVGMMSKAMGDMAYYLVLAYAAAHFVAMFGWSNLGLITAVTGAEAIEASGMPLPLVLASLVLLTGFINLFVGSASAKWALLAPVFVPMFMLLGVSPEATTAAYRVGDSATNIITPLMVYFPLILVFARRWIPGFGLGSLTAIMVPYSVLMLIIGFIMMLGWVYLGWPLGPGAGVEYVAPAVGG
ncbi:AbgT family transporter [Hyphobacterium sp. HN65]|uniref:AbgT family transporter n=1 Tax=Hyphobacterium lacteum TaxID=3116575 RepID=A0ABU7LNB6_9PROT|nr:AbgT family transporter [Hyphobacterium sp. HN65]MEE2525416.1 AbgT family transporter [Hyphobacterium sp. HN65]